MFTYRSLCFHPSLFSCLCNLCSLIVHKRSPNSIQRVLIVHSQFKREIRTSQGLLLQHFSSLTFIWSLVFALQGDRGERGLPGLPGTGVRGTKPLTMSKCNWSGKRSCWWYVVVSKKRGCLWFVDYFQEKEVYQGPQDLEASQAFLWVLLFCNYG